MQPAEPSSSLLVLSMDDYISKRQKAHASCPSFSSSCWEGVVRVEMELVECCERLHENDDDENDDEVATKGGVLAIEKEVRFAAILARSCHTMSSKILAMAILERSLENYLAEENCIGEHHIDNSSTQKNDHNTTEKGKSVPERFDYFFAAGGLKILNQWLIEASSDDMMPDPSYDERVKKEVTKSRKTSNSRPIILALLHFLQNIPFEKTMVLSSKIDKQIQKIAKQVATITDAQKDEDTALLKIKDAVNIVKKSWREKASEKKHGQEISRPSLNDDPFELIKKTIHEKVVKQNYGETEPVTTTRRSNRRRTQGNEEDKLILQQKLKQVQSRNQKSLQELREKLRKRKIETAVSSVDSLQGKIGKKKRVVWKDGLKGIEIDRTVLEDVLIFTKDLPSSADENKIKC